MTTATTPAGAASAPMNLFAAFVGIITAPRDTYARIVMNPKWLGMYVLTSAIIAFGAALPTTTDAGKQAAVEQQVSAMESMGFQVSDEQYANIQKGTAILPYQTAISVVIFGIVMALILAGILFAIFNAAMGGNATFKQILTVLVHGSVITALGQLFTGPINYFRGAVTSATSLGSLLPMLDEQSFAGKLAGMIDIFVIWWLIVLAIGLAVLYRRKTQPIAMTFFGIYAAIIVALAAFTST